MATLTKEDLRKGLPVRASTVNTIAGSLNTSLEIATLDGGAIVTAGAESLSAAKAYNAPIRTDLADSDSAGRFVLVPPAGARIAVIYPFIWAGPSEPVEDAEGEFAVWFIEMGYFGAVPADRSPSGEVETPTFLRGNYRGHFACVAGNQKLNANDPIAIKLGNTEVAHCDSITPTLDAEAIDTPVVTGGATPNDARHGVVMDCESAFRIVIEGRSKTAEAKIGFEIRYW